MYIHTYNWVSPCITYTYKYNDIYMYMYIHTYIHTIGSVPIPTNIMIYIQVHTYIQLGQSMHYLFLHKYIHMYYLPIPLKFAA